MPEMHITSQVKKRFAPLKKVCNFLLTFVSPYLDSGTHSVTKSRSFHHKLTTLSLQAGGEFCTMGFRLYSSPVSDARKATLDICSRETNAATTPAVLHTRRRQSLGPPQPALARSSHTYSILVASKSVSRLPAGRLEVKGFGLAVSCEILGSLDLHEAILCNYLFL